MMKHLLTAIAAIFFISSASAQTYAPDFRYGQNSLRGAFDSTLHIPYGDTILHSNKVRAGAVMMHTDKNIYSWNGARWNAIGGTTYVQGFGLLFAGTTIKVDTFSISTRANRDALKDSLMAYIVANYVSLNGSYSNPPWIADFPYSKLTGIPTAGYGIKVGSSIGLADTNNLAGTDKTFVLRNSGAPASITHNSFNVPFSEFYYPATAYGSGTPWNYAYLKVSRTATAFTAMWQGTGSGSDYTSLTVDSTNVKLSGTFDNNSDYVHQLLLGKNAAPGLTARRGIGFLLSGALNGDSIYMRSYFAGGSYSLYNRVSYDTVDYSPLGINKITGAVVRMNGWPVGASGSGSGTVNSGTQYRLGYYATTGTGISPAAAITASRALVSDANGVPTHSPTTSTEVGYSSGVTGPIQAQLDSKQGTALLNGKVLVGNGSNVATAVTPTGDVTITNAGVTNIPEAHGSPANVTDYYVNGLVPSYNANNNASEGIYQNIGGDTIINVFRVDTTIHHHASGDGRVFKRMSYDGGMTWTDTATIYNSIYDEVNIGGGKVGSNITVWFRRYNVGGAATVDVGYIYSTDRGASWSAYTTITPSVSSNVVPNGKAIYTNDGTYLQLLYGSGTCEGWRSSNGTTWTAQGSIYTQANRQEPKVSNLGGGKMLMLIRQNGSAPTQFYQATSTDNGYTFSTPVVSNAGQYYESRTNPFLISDTANGNIIYAYGQRHRGATVLNSDVSNDSIMISVNKIANVFSNPSGWVTPQFSLKRPIPATGANDNFMYGYLDGTRLTNGNFSLIVTDKYMSGSLEYASLWQFDLNKRYSYIRDSARFGGKAIYNSYTKGNDYVSDYSNEFWGYRDSAMVNRPNKHVEIHQPHSTTDSSVLVLTDNIRNNIAEFRMKTSFGQLIMNGATNDNVSSIITARSINTNGNTIYGKTETAKDSSTKVASTQYVDKAVQAGVNTLDTRPYNVRVASNFTTTSTTLADVTGLSIAVDANKEYDVRVYLKTACDNTGGIGVSFNGPASSTVAGDWNGNRILTTSNSYAQGTYGTIYSGSAFNAYAGDGAMTFIGHISTGATAGTLTVRLKSVTAGQTSTVYAASGFSIQETR